MSGEQISDLEAAHLSFMQRATPDKSVCVHGAENVRLCVCSGCFTGRWLIAPLPTSSVRGSSGTRVLNRLCYRTGRDPADSTGTLHKTTSRTLRGSERHRECSLSVTSSSLNDSGREVVQLLTAEACCCPINLLRFGKGGLITPQGSKQSTLTDVQITSKQPSRRSKQMTRLGFASSLTEIACESRRVNVRQPVGPTYSSF